MPVSTTTWIGLGIQTLAEAIQLTPVSPAAQAILKVSCSVLQLIEDGKRDNKDMQRLAEQVLSIALAYSDGLKLFHAVEDNASNLTSLSDELFRCLEAISQALQATSKKGFLTRALGRSATLKRLRDSEEELLHIAMQLEVIEVHSQRGKRLHKFQTQIQLRNAKLTATLSLPSNVEEIERLVEERVALAHEESLQLIRSQLLEESRKKLQLSSFGHLPPTASSIFFGRTEYVDRVVSSLVNVPAHHAILGPGGIGKTSVALNVLHDPRIVATYGKHRYFLACETTPNVCGIVAGLADVFNLEEKGFMKSFKRLCQIIGSNILFLLDNFETPWESKETCGEVEELLAELAGISNLSIIITLRGAERPYGVPWSRPFLPVLTPLDFDAARQTFLSISDVSGDNEAMDRLLEEVDCVPLAITLLAAQAQYTSCSVLLEQWHTSKTSIVTRGWESRLTSLDVSISLSLTSSRFTYNPQALSLLQILSLLPDGATVEELDAMTTDVFDVSSSVSTLFQVALAYSGAHNRVRALVPIREYVQSNHPIPLALLKNLLDYHAALSNYASSSTFTAEDMFMHDRLRPCINNIHHVVGTCFQVDSMSEQAIQAAVDVASFHHQSYSGAISILLEEAATRARLAKKPLLQAKCLMKLCIFQNNPKDQDNAKGYILEAVSILRSLPYSESCEELASTLPQLAAIISNFGQHREATPIAREGVSLLTESSKPVTRAVAYMKLGACLIKDGDFGEGLKVMKLAGSSFDPAVYPSLAVSYSEHLCAMYWRRDMLSHVVDAANTCLGTNIPSRRYWKAGVILGHRGMAYSAMARYDAARNDFRESIELLASSAKEYHMAYILKNLGFSYMACGNFEAAFTTIRGAHQFDDSANYFGPNMAMAILELQQNHIDNALVYCDRAAEDNSHLRVMSAERLNVFQVRSQVQMRRGKAADAMSSCILAAILSHKFNDLNSISIAILCLGDAFFFLEKDVDTAAACYSAFMELVRYTGMRRWIANAMMRLGVTDYLQGVSSRAVRRLNQATRFYSETEGELWAAFCQDRLRPIEHGVVEENVPFFPPICCMSF